MYSRVCAVGWSGLYAGVPICFSFEFLIPFLLIIHIVNLAKLKYVESVPFGSSVAIVSSDVHVLLREAIFFLLSLYAM